MIQELRLDWQNTEVYASLDFTAKVLTIVNPTPFPVWGRAGALGPPVTSGGQTYIVPAGTTMTVPIKQRSWGFKLLTSGSEPSSMAPAMIFFTEDEVAPTVVASGVATVSYEYMAWGKQIDLGANITLINTAWLALDDNRCFLDVSAPSGRGLVTVNTHYKVGSTGLLTRLLWGVYDDVDNDTYKFSDIIENAYNETHSGTFSGVIEFIKPGTRRLYLRGREAANGAGVVVSRYLNFSFIRG